MILQTTFNKRLAIACLIMLSTYFVKAQVIEINPEVGYGLYSFSDLRDFHDEIISSQQFGMQNTDDFPGYINYGLSAVFYPKDKLFGFGLRSSFYSTGSKYSYEDYSGFISSEILADAVNIGGLVSFKNELSETLFLNMQLSSGIKFTGLTFQDELVVSDELLSDNEIELKSNGFWIEPRLTLEKKFHKLFSIGIFAAYEINAKSKIHLKGEKDSELTFSNNEEVKVSWSGLRVGLYLTILQSLEE